MEQEVKLWTQPQLVILSRGRPEENILRTCKAWWFLTGPHGNFRGCRREDDRDDDDECRLCGDYSRT